LREKHRKLSAPVKPDNVMVRLGLTWFDGFGWQSGKRVLRCFRWNGLGSVRA
jgi:hypothetical protein